MEDIKEKNPRLPRINFERIIGFILLVPPVLGVFVFLIGLSGTELELRGLSKPDFWSGDFSNGGYQSPGPIYLGLMAIAGAVLLKNSTTKV